MALADFYPLIKASHVGLVMLSGGLFAGRGVGVLLGATMPMSPLVRRCSEVIDTALLVAAVLLNNPFKMMWHWLYWRWLYYVRDISEVDVACVLNAAKKKLPQEPFCLATILAIGMTDLMMTMRSAEAQSIQAERRGEQHTL